MLEMAFQSFWFLKFSGGACPRPPKVKVMAPCSYSRLFFSNQLPTSNFIETPALKIPSFDGQESENVKVAVYFQGRTNNKSGNFPHWPYNLCPKVTCRCNSFLRAFKVLKVGEKHQIHSCSALSIQVVCHQQRCLWSLDEKNLLSYVAVAVDQSSDMAMIFVLSIHQIPATAQQIWTTRTSVQQVRMVTRFLQEMKPSLSVK